MGVTVQDLGFTVHDLGVTALVLGVRGSGLVVRVWGLGLRVWGSIFEAWGLGFGVGVEESQGQGSLPGNAHRLEGSTLETTQGQMDGFFSQLPYKCHQTRVASVGD